MVTQRLIDTVLPLSGGKFLTVKFADGCEVVAPADKVFLAPLEAGVEAWVASEQRESKGRDFDYLTFWGPKEAYGVQNASPVQLQIAAQAPLMANEADKAVRPPIRPSEVKKVKFDTRELSIMAQVALKEACQAGNARGAMSKDGFETTGVTVTRMKAYLKGMVEAVEKLS